MVGILNIQIKPILENKEINLKKIRHFIKRNSNKKLDLVIMPEFFSTGVADKYFLTHPEDENGGEIIKELSEIAKEYHTNIVTGTVIEKSDGKFYNTTFVLNREGEIVGKYRKIHLYNYLGGNEGQTITAGDEEVVVNLDFGKVGLSICFDIRYPLHYNKLAKMGAEIIVSPSAWIVPNDIYQDSETLRYAQEMWVAMNRIRAYDNSVYFVTSNLTKDVNKNLSCIGTSLIISPTAEILANAKNDECGIYAEIDLSAVKYLRQLCPILND